MEKDYIVGLIRITMENLNYDEADIQAVVWEALDGTLSIYTEGQIKEAACGLLTGVSRGGAGPLGKFTNTEGLV
ncbi:MAG TPA: hypothetical protein DCZ91_12010 [Lachnospiraceae bacterium]|nr:hypothetical protein [Lachnospiraceae bacterium]